VALQCVQYARQYNGPCKRHRTDRIRGETPGCRAAGGSVGSSSGLPWRVFVGRSWKAIAKTWDILGAWEIRPAGRLDVARNSASPPLRARDPLKTVYDSIPGCWFGGAMRLRLPSRYWLATPEVDGASSDAHGSETDAPSLRHGPGTEVGASLSPLVLQDEPSSDRGFTMKHRDIYILLGVIPRNRCRPLSASVERAGPAAEPHRRSSVRMVGECTSRGGAG